MKMTNNMKKITRFFFGFMIAEIVFSASAANMDAEKTNVALNQIRIFANQMCDEVPLQGTEGHLQLTGEAKAKLKGVVKAVADAGVSGAATYNSEDYSGLLRRDLLIAQENRNLCRKAIFDGLKDKLLPESGSKKSSDTSIHKRKLPPVSLTFDDFAFETQSNTLFLRAVFNNTSSNPVTVTSISFGAAATEREGKRLLGTEQSVSIALPPHVATPYNIEVQVGAKQANEFTLPENTPEYLFVLLGTVDSAGNVIHVTKHFMTLNYLRETRVVLGTLFAMPLQILDDKNSPIYLPGKNTFIVSKALMRAVN